MVGFALSGILADAFGWEWVFYFFAIASMIFCILWVFLVFSTPNDHPRISEEEKHYIQVSLGSSKNLGSERKLPQPPFKVIAKSVPFWAQVFTLFASAWGFYTLQTDLPTYLNNIQHVPIALVKRIFT